MEKVKCWVVYDKEYPGGVIYRDRGDALSSSRKTRDSGLKSYLRVKYFTEKELAEMPEAE